MTKERTIWMALLVLAACCTALAEQPVVWYPAQQQPDSQSAQPPSGQTGQQPSAPAGQPQGEAQPGTQPGQQPGVPPGVPPGQQPATPASSDPRLDQPLQPLGPIAPATQSSVPEQAAPVLAPDVTPLNSPMELTLGSEVGGRNYFTPSIRFTQFVDYTSGIPDQGTFAVMTPVGTIDLRHSWSRAQATLRYSAGGIVSPSNSDLNAAFQKFGLTTGLQFGRWSLTMADSASYTPESPFGYYGLSGFGPPPVGPGYLPNQSILTQASQISNALSVTLARSLSARSTLHFSGGWAILRYQGGGISNTDQYNYSAGYDRSFGANTLGIAYVGSIYNIGATETITTHGASLAYGRRLTGRLALQVSGGPVVYLVDNPAVGSDSAPSWNARAGLSYATRKMMLSSWFSRYTSAGAGVLAGADTLIWGTSVNRSFARVWNASAGFGVSRNSAFAESVAQNQFNTQFVYFQLGRPVGRESSVFISYNFQHQTSDLPLCTGCGNSFDRHVVGMGFEWHRRPIALGY